MPASSPWVVQTSPTTFQQDVIDPSREVPVVVDFWAPWCQPCRLLGPMLEKLANEHQGKFVLVKANTEELPELAAAFGVDGIPAVFALRDGRLIDQFVGLLPEPQLRAWLERILPRPAEQLVDQALALESADPQAAEAKYREAIGMEPNDVLAQTGLARVLLKRGDLDESRRILDDLASAGAIDAEGERLRAEILLREQARAAAAADPDNLDLQLNLARALAAAGRQEESLQTALRVVESDRRGHGEQARELMVSLFHHLGVDSPLASDYRRKLALALY